MGFFNSYISTNFGTTSPPRRFELLKNITMDKERNYYKNTFHHLYNRGANKALIFYERENYRAVLKIIFSVLCEIEIDY